MRDSQQVVDFRSKLINSGFFSTVVVEEQNPTQERQKVILRISAQFKPAPGRESLPMISTSPATVDIEKPKALGKEVRSNAPPEKALSAPAAARTNPPPKLIE
jgi:hypothetical protein